MLFHTLVAVNTFGKASFPLLEPSYGLPNHSQRMDMEFAKEKFAKKSLWNQPNTMLLELLPHLRFCWHTCQSLTWGHRGYLSLVRGFYRDSHQPPSSCMSRPLYQQRQPWQPVLLSICRRVSAGDCGWRSHGAGASAKCSEHRQQMLGCTFPTTWSNLPTGVDSLDIFFTCVSKTSGYRTDDVIAESIVREPSALINSL